MKRARVAERLGPGITPDVEKKAAAAEGDRMPAPSPEAPISLDERVALLRQCDQPWTAREEEGLRRELPPDLLHEALRHYAKTGPVATCVRKLGVTYARLLPNALAIKHAGKLPTVTAST